MRSESNNTHKGLKIRLEDDLEEVDRVEGARMGSHGMERKRKRQRAISYDISEGREEIQFHECIH